MSSIRKPYVAGTFYPLDTQELKYMLNELYNSTETKEIQGRIKICVVPHAGYVYSGRTAMKVYKLLENQEKPDSILILGTKHTPYGAKNALANYDVWETPLGPVFENVWLVENLSKITGVPVDNIAHETEHSIEVQLPFLQFIYEEIPKIIPMVIGEQNLDKIIDLAEKIFDFVKEKNILIVISTDFTHYEADPITRKKDQIAINKILNLDPKGLYKEAIEKDISICGLGALLIGVYIAKSMNLKAELIDYSTSSDISGDISFSVGYAGIVFY